jgi:phenylacetate-CoA ligase
MSEFYDALETRDPAQREADFFVRLRATLDNAKAHAPYWRQTLDGVDPASVSDRAALARLPVTRKSDLMELQKSAPPFGGMLAVPVGHLARVFVSPGPINDPEGHEADYWGTARGLFAAGFRKGDLALNCLSYHLTPGARILECGLHALGCAVIPGGVGQSEQQAQAVAMLKPSGYAGTPSFLRIILEKARELGLDISAITKAFVSGEALPPSLRAEFEGQGITVLQGYASADLGLIAYESSAREGLIINENLLVEIVRPGTGDPVLPGEVGEVVVTNLLMDYPLIRFATGDLSAVLAGTSPCGRTSMRIKGWMGRADQTTKVKGMFVHPHQVAEVLKRHPEILKGRLVVSGESGQDVMTLKCETKGAGDALAGAIKDSLHGVTKMHGAVDLVDPGALPNDGKVIEDARKYD